MKIISYLAVFCAVLISYLLAVSETNLQAEEQDVFSGLAIGDRVEIATKSKRAHAGIIKLLTKDKITIDISYDDPDLKGKISFRKKEIKEIKKLAVLDEDEKKRIIAEKDRLAEQYRKDMKAWKPPKEEEPAEVQPPAEEKTSEEKEREKLLALLEKFPPAKGWNDDRKKDILEKMGISRTAEEKEFLEAFDDWTRAKELTAKESRRALIEKFPPGEWDKKKYDELSARFINFNIGLSPKEQEFVDKFKDWEKAVEEKKAEDEAKRKKEEEEQKKKQEEEEETPPTPPSESESKQ